MTTELGSIEAVRRPTAVQRWAQFAASVYLMLGIFGLLRSGLGDITSPDGRHVFVVLSHPITALVHLAIGLVGVYAATRLAWARVFLGVLSGLLVAWAVFGLTLDGEPNDVFTADRWTVAVHLVPGLVSLVMALVPARAAAPEDAGPA
ncbi:MAG TPA: DUF4383 domain-containing protein [Miltoncostaeaceae bacterium]|nr:DUF4383 domain-containing protein [Miltoncostaeaceae bacterium]